MNLNGDLNYEKKALKALLGSDDIIFFDFETGGNQALCVYVDSITDKETLGLEVIAPLSKNEDDKPVSSLAKKDKSRKRQDRDRIVKNRRQRVVGTRRNTRRRQEKSDMRRS